MTDHATPHRRVCRAIDGVLLLDKAVGISSNRALQQVKHLFGAAKAGHTGTLDPMCSGLLPICFGEATKFSSFHLAADKRYRATLRLGVTTSTGDAEGRVAQIRDVALQSEQIDAALIACLGPQLQVPPMYSALKLEGKPLYQYARAGVEVERKPRAIEIYALELVQRAGSVLMVDVHCSKGTYVRVLAETLGELLGCGAHLVALRRLASGDFNLKTAQTFDQLAALEGDQRLSALRPVDSLLDTLPKVQLEGDAARRFSLGQTVDWSTAVGELQRVYAPAGTLLGIASWAGGKLSPKRLLSNAANRLQRQN